MLGVMVDCSRNADFGPYRMVGDCWEALCDLLSVKCELG